MDKKIRIIFLCTGNSCRSQMAEAFANALKGDAIEARSAGVEVHGLNPLAVKVMAEAGIDISKARSKHVSEFDDESFDYAVTLCDSAKAACPVMPPPIRMRHAGFDDPPALAQAIRILAADRNTEGGTEGRAAASPPVLVPRFVADEK